MIGCYYDIIGSRSIVRGTYKMYFTNFRYLCRLHSCGGLVDVLRQVVLWATILVDRLLVLGHFFVRHELYRHTPQHASPRHVVRTTLFAASASAVALSLALALAAHKADGLSVPVVHQVK